MSQCIFVYRRAYATFRRGDSCSAQATTGRYCASHTYAIDKKRKDVPVAVADNDTDDDGDYELGVFDSVLVAHPNDDNHLLPVKQHNDLVAALHTVVTEVAGLRRDLDALRHTIDRRRQSDDELDCESLANVDRLLDEVRAAGVEQGQFISDVLRRASVRMDEPGMSDLVCVLAPRCLATSRAEKTLYVRVIGAALTGRRNAVKKTR